MKRIHPINIEITEYLCLRYIERFNMNLNSIRDYKERLKQAEIGIKSIIQNAHYISDDDRGILLHSPTHKCNLIVRNRKLITLFNSHYKKRFENER